MGRGGDMDDVDVGTGQDLAKIPIAGDTGAARFEGGLEMVFVDVTDGQEAGAFIF